MSWTRPRWPTITAAASAAPPAKPVEDIRAAVALGPGPALVLEQVVEGDVVELPDPRGPDERRPVRAQRPVEPEAPYDEGQGQIQADGERGDEGKCFLLCISPTVPTNLHHHLNLMMKLVPMLGEMDIHPRRD